MFHRTSSKASNFVLNILILGLAPSLYCSNISGLHTYNFFLVWQDLSHFLQGLVSLIDALNPSIASYRCLNLLRHTPYAFACSGYARLNEGFSLM